MRDLTSKVAVVTGAASGIGRAMALRFAAEGMKVVLADIEGDALRRTGEEMKAAGYTAAMTCVDTSKADGVGGLAAFAVERFGGVHVLCNNAGVGIGGVLWEHSEEDWEWLLSVNVIGVVNGLRAFVPLMLAQGDECHIVNTASAAGLDARPWLGAYSATKYAVVAISEALRDELAMRGARIGVSVLCPALVNTRIAESERNRPGDKLLPGPRRMSDDAAAFDETFRTALAAGLPPEAVAAEVADAIRSGRFYIITHSETEARVRARFGRILNDTALAVSPEMQVK
jgi:NAD(P)-dependent dehydrogenase (short-subunit alcohol dehydrogenase family)